jgi:hypothetical protein
MQIKRELLQLEGYFFLKASIADLIRLLSSSVLEFEGGGFLRLLAKILPGVNVKKIKATKYKKRF